MKIALSITPKEIIIQYNLRALVTDGRVYMEIRKGMPGLKQAGKITNNRLKLHLSKFGYAPVAHTTSLWKYSSKNIKFTLAVDNFGVKYVGKQHTEHLIQVLQQLYTLCIDCTGTFFCGLTIAWDY